MTVENCLTFLAEYKKRAEDTSLSSSVRKQSQVNYDNMKAHILNSKKFMGHPILEELQEKPKEIAKPERYLRL